MDDTDKAMLIALEEASYDMAQICGNGHLINENAYNNSEDNQNYCTECGAPTYIRCEKCRMFIRGGRIDLTGIHYRTYSIPSFCLYCGEAYPWTAAKLKAAKDLADELEGLNDEEKSLLKQSIDDLVRESPQTTVAATRFKRIIVKGGKEVATSIKDILVDIASETAKKLLWP